MIELYRSTIAYFLQSNKEFELNLKFDINAPSLGTESFYFV